MSLLFQTIKLTTSPSNFDGILEFWLVLLLFWFWLIKEPLGLSLWYAVRWFLNWDSWDFKINDSMKLRATQDVSTRDEISKQTIKTLIILENKWLQMTRWRKKRTIDESDQMNRTAKSLEVFWIQKTKFFKFPEKNLWPPQMAQVSRKYQW